MMPLAGRWLSRASGDCRVDEDLICFQTPLIQMEIAI